MNIIANNPYRILGVLSNASKKEIVANQGKIKAFLKTGKTISFENDFDAILSPIVRSNELLAQAVNATSLPKDRVAAGLFWFMSITKFDEIALNHLRNGDKDSAISLLRKKPTVSACINIAIINLLEEKWGTALYYYTYLLNSEERRQELLALLTENIGNVTEKEIVSIFVDNLLLYNTTINWMDFLLQHEVDIQGEIKSIGNFYITSNVYETFKKRITTNALKDIDQCLNTASSVKKEDPKANINAAHTLETKSKILLRSLRACLGKDSKKYISLSDKIANQILNNCIDYYNYEKNNPNRAREIIAFLRYAYRTAEGQLVKDRCKKNLDIIKEECESLLPSEIEIENKIIESLIGEFKTKQSLSDSHISSLESTLDTCRTQLASVELKLGCYSKHYTKLSSKIVHFALDVIVDDVNSYMYKYNKALGSNKIVEYGHLVFSLRRAKPLFDIIAKFQMDESTQKRYTENKNTFISLYTKHLLSTVENHHNNTNTGYTRPNSSQTTARRNGSYVSSSYTSSSPNNKTESSDDGKIYFVIICICIFFTLICFSVCSNNDESYNSANTTTASYTESPEVEKAKEYLANETETSISNSSYDSPPAKSQEEVWLEKYRFNSLQTGATPYKAKYGGNSKSGNAGISIKGPIGTDVLVIIKNESGAVVKHAYIQAAQTYSFRIKPGTYQPFFIFGQSWCPEKPAPNGEFGYFLESVSINKDSPQKIDAYQELEYTLQTVRNGNFHAAYSNSEEAF